MINLQILSLYGPQRHGTVEYNNKCGSTTSVVDSGFLFHVRWHAEINSRGQRGHPRRNGKILTISFIIKAKQSKAKMCNGHRLEGLHRGTPDFISLNLWPLNSHDPCPVDYQI